MAAASASASAPSFFLTLSCQDRPGIVFKVSSFLAENNLNILESNQHGDAGTNQFFMRTHFAVVPGESKLTTVGDVKQAFTGIGQDLGGQWEIHSAEEKVRVCLMVSKFLHCANDICFRHLSGQLPIEIPLVVSNHLDFEPFARNYGIPFYHIPITKETKAEGEAKLLDLIKEYKVDLAVMARYMQVMSANFCEVGPPTINIHHSFLPSFAGANPYRQAHDRGVKLIGASAHFASADLDEGPLIEQDTARVNHSMDVKALTHLGSTIESTVLARAVRWYAERRVLVNGRKTVVFS